VEARFTVHPSVRPVKDLTFCQGGPRNTSHVTAQAILEPGESRDIALTLDTRALRVRSPQSQAHAELIVEDGGAAEVSFDVDAPAIQASAARVASGRVTLKFVNRLKHPALVVVERSAWDSQAVTGAVLTSFQTFRDLFSEDVVAPGREVAIRSIALVFTDLKGSTEMYRRKGDATAYAIVRDHFTFLTEIVAACRGAVVKTIGDAVMAAFSVTADAVRAALRFHTEIGPWCEARGIDPPLALKIGVHAGPTIAVNSNDVLDYFGSTVNIAARVQEQSGGDVLVTETVYLDPQAKALIDGVATTRHMEEAKFRGFVDLFRVRRLTGLRRETTLKEETFWSVA